MNVYHYYGSVEQCKFTPTWNEWSLSKRVRMSIENFFLKKKEKNLWYFFFVNLQELRIIHEYYQDAEAINFLLLCFLQPMLYLSVSLYQMLFIITSTRLHFYFLDQAIFCWWWQAGYCWTWGWRGRQYTGSSSSKHAAQPGGLQTRGQQ